MVCEAGLSGVEYLMDFEFLQAVTCTYADAAGLAVVGTMVLGGIAASIYIRTGSLLIPFGLVLMTGGATMTFVAGPLLGLVTVMLLLLASGIVTILYNEYSR